ncbi:MAG: hypothetical protein DCC56_07470 [Anaerolineae bacterium]|nr:MAG: hypothetical protein DCC56_07470 [Anaerolineae bacterium]
MKKLRSYFFDLFAVLWMTGIMFVFSLFFGSQQFWSIMEALGIKVLLLSFRMIIQPYFYDLEFIYFIL